MTSKKTEDPKVSLDESRIRFQQLVKHLPAKLLRYDLTLKKFVYLNSDKYWNGYSLEEWNEYTEKRRQSYIHPRDLDEWLEQTQSWLASDKKNPLKLTFRLLSGDRYLWLDCCYYLEYSSDGKPVSIVELSFDISEMKNNEQECDEWKDKCENSADVYRNKLAEMDEYYQEMFDEHMQDKGELSTKKESFENLSDNSIDGIIVTALDHHIVYANNRASEITGYKHDNLLKLSVTKLFKESELAAEIERIEKRGKKERIPRHYQTEMKCADKSKLTIGLAIVRIVWQSEQANAYSIYDYIDRRIAVGKRISKMVHRAVQQHHTIGGIVSKNPTIMKLFEILPTIANSESSLLITGESGTGKELLVKNIHNLSPRKDKPLITVNCAALPDTLIEAELFGYKKGAFTDARQDKPGRFVQAEGGTLFLDEIGDVSPAMQVKLLRVLQEKTIEPLGSNESLKVNTRIIVATNRDLDRMIEDGAFRQDLYYRINVIRLELPPLRERIEDIPVLVEHFIGKFREMFGKDITSVSPAAIEVLMNYDYPGNIRELENFIEHAFLLCRGDKIIPEHLPIPPYASRGGQRGGLKHPPPVAGGGIKGGGPNIPPPPPTIVGGDKGGGAKSPPSPVSIKDSETNLILECLEKNNWNRTATARELGIHRITLIRKIHKLEIELPKIDGRSAYRNIS